MSEIIERYGFLATTRNGRIKGVFSLFNSIEELMKYTCILGDDVEQIKDMKKIKWSTNHGLVATWLKKGEIK